MTKGPEPQDGFASAYSINAQLEAFKKELGEYDMKIALPGFLFRNGIERQLVLSPTEQKDPRNFEVTHLDHDLLLRQTETYERGLEARFLLLEKAKPIEILEMIKDVWGRGVISQDELGVAVTYSFSVVEKETRYHESSYESKNINAGETTLIYHPGYYYETGLWTTRAHSVCEEICIDFGNSEFPHPKDIYTSALDEYFADRYQGGSYYPSTMLKRTPDPFADYLWIPNFRGIPETIWRRPDNLGVCIGRHWFNQAVSQQEIMTFLSHKLKAQKMAGQLPSQIEALELAKIEELRKRGKFRESK